MSGLSGWVSIDRKILDHWSASEPEALAVWVRLILEANHSDTKKLFNGTLTEIKRGQVVFGYPAFSQKSGVSVAKLRRIMSMFEKDGMISRQTTNKYSLISITCYDKYQSTDRQTAGESQADNKQTAGKSQHRNNVNNDNNGNKDIYPAPANADARFQLPTNRYNSMGETFPVDDEQIRLWQETYPSVNVEQEIRKMYGWLDGNPAKRKTMGGMKRFANSWLAKQQDKGGSPSMGDGNAFTGTDWAR